MLYLYHALCLSVPYHIIPLSVCLSVPYHSNTEAALFACLLSGWATTTGRLLGPEERNSIKCLSQGHSDALPHRKSNLYLIGLGIIIYCIYQGTSTRRQRSDLFGLRVKLLPVTTILATKGRGNPANALSKDTTSEVAGLSPH